MAALADRADVGLGVQEVAVGAVGAERGVCSLVGVAVAGSAVPVEQFKTRLALPACYG